MLTRRLEPEVCDTHEEASDYDAMDHSTVNARFCEDFLLLAPDVTRVLDVGTGTALIPIELCRRSPAAHVVAIDLSAEMLALGATRVKDAGFADRVTLDRLDAKHTGLASGSFTAVVSNSIVHHIPEPGPVLAEMVRVLSPGGWLFVRDLLRPDSLADLRRIVETYASCADDHQRGMFHNSLHAALTLDEIRELVRPLGFGADAVQRTSDRHWTLAARRS